MLCTQKCAWRTKKAHFGVIGHTFCVQSTLHFLTVNVIFSMSNLVTGHPCGCSVKEL